jgi:hypothetical protein
LAPGKTVFGPDSLGATSVMNNNSMQQPKLGMMDMLGCGTPSNEGIRHQDQAVMG